MGFTQENRSYLHYDPVRIDYTVNDHELQLLAGTGSLWKDICLVTGSLGVPCLINAIAEVRTQSAFAITLPMFLNFLFGVVGIALCVAFAIAWCKTHRSAQSLIDAIKKKPRLRINNPSLVDVGALPEHTVNPQPPLPPAPVPDEALSPDTE